MTLLALGSGRRLGFVHRSGAVFLQTLLWILCAAVCGSEQYFNVEVSVPGWPLPLAGPPPTRLSPRVRAPRAAGVCALSLQPGRFARLHLGDGCAETESVIPEAQRMLCAQLGRGDGSRRHRERPRGAPGGSPAPVQGESTAREPGPGTGRRASAPPGRSLFREPARAPAPRLTKAANIRIGAAGGRLLCLIAQPGGKTLDQTESSSPRDLS